jgi:hypothetical protein
VLGHQRGLVGLHLAGDADHLVGGRQLEVELDRHRIAQHAQVAVLNVTPVLAQVECDTIGST